jgi:hypothetical protein
MIQPSKSTTVQIDFEDTQKFIFEVINFRHKNNFDAFSFEGIFFSFRQREKSQFRYHFSGNNKFLSDAIFIFPLNLK